MTTRRAALGGLALLVAGTGAARDGSRGWRIELRAGRGAADAVAAIPVLQAKAAEIDMPQPRVTRRGASHLVLTWNEAVDPETAEAVFYFLPRFWVNELFEVSPMVSSSFDVPGARKDDLPAQMGRGLLDSHDLDIATVARDRQGLPEVLLRWTASGARRASHLTPRLLGHRVLIAVGGRPVSAPLVVSRFRRVSSIGGLFTPESAASTAAAINGAAVAGRLKLVRSRALRHNERSGE